MVVLTIKAFVKVSILVTPKSVSFTGYEGQVLSRTVKITAKEEKPLEIAPVRFNIEDKIEYKIETIEPGKIFEIHFTNKPAQAGTYIGELRLKTNYPDKPDITIPLRARFRKHRVTGNPESSMKSVQ